MLQRDSLRKEKILNTPSQSKAVEEPEREPVVSFTRVIEIAPSSSSFGGWGPKVVGLTSTLVRWN